MAGRAFLHIGAPKTGTTFLQRVLWRHRDLLLEQGILLPLRSVKTHFYAAIDLRGGSAPAPDGADVTGAWDRVVEGAREHDGDVLVSHELMCLVGPDSARRAVESFSSQGREVHVVITARDYGRQLTSHWQEAIKSRRTATFGDFMAEAADPASGYGRYLRQTEDYAAMARRWAVDVPFERVHVVTVPPPGAPRDLLWRRFAEVLSLPADRFDLQVAGNESLGVEQAELLRRLNLALGERLPRPGPYPSVVKVPYGERILAKRPGRKLTLGGEDLAFARERASAVVDELRTLGVDVVGDLDDLRVTGDDAGHSSAREPIADDVLLAEAIEATAALLDADLAMRLSHREKVEQLRRRIAELEQAQPARGGGLRAMLGRRRPH
jgi:hypothetical protein